jgi:hypothetical protein
MDRELSPGRVELLVTRGEKRPFPHAECERPANQIPSVGRGGRRSGETVVSEDTDLTLRGDERIVNEFPRAPSRPFSREPW